MCAILYPAVVTHYLKLANAGISHVTLSRSGMPGATTKYY